MVFVGGLPKKPHGAEGGTRTRTDLSTAPSRQRVYQFHHFGIATRLATKLATRLGLLRGIGHVRHFGHFDFRRCGFDLRHFGRTVGGLLVGYR